MKADAQELRCPYCERLAVYLEESSTLYHGTDYGPAWACYPCEAWVGCHPGTSNPLGRLANKTLRRLKQDAHAVFDPLWEERQRRDGITKNKARGKAYKWLADQLGINRKLCHIGMFDEYTCRRTIDICTPYARALRRKQHGR